MEYYPVSFWNDDSSKWVECGRFYSNALVVDWGLIPDLPIDEIVLDGKIFRGDLKTWSFAPGSSAWPKRYLPNAEGIDPDDHINHNYTKVAGLYRGDSSSYEAHNRFHVKFALDFEGFDRFSPKTAQYHKLREMNYQQGNPPPMTIDISDVKIIIAYAFTDAYESFGFITSDLTDSTISLDRATKLCVWKTWDSSKLTLDDLFNRYYAAINVKDISR